MPSLEHAPVADAMRPGNLPCQADPKLTDFARVIGASGHGERRLWPAGGVETSGGVRSREREAALAMVAAGATRVARLLRSPDPRR
jgi:hypothetical protein